MQSAIQLQFDFSKPIVITIEQEHTKITSCVKNEEIAKKIIHELDQHESSLHSRERGILASIKTWMENNRLTSRQVDLLRCLHAKALTC